MRDVNYSELDPGIRSTVEFLREHGFETTESGDGISKPQDQRTLHVPHVFMVVDPPKMVTESDRLYNLIKNHGYLKEDTHIEAAYNPTDGIAVIIFLGRVPDKN